MDGVLCENGRRLVELLDNWARPGNSELDLSVFATEFAVDGCDSVLARGDLCGYMDYGGEAPITAEGFVAGGVG